MIRLLGLIGSQVLVTWPFREHAGTLPASNRHWLVAVTGGTVTHPSRNSHGLPARAAADEQLECEWIERIRSGDATAFEALFRAYYRRLAGFCYRYVRSRELAEDVVHDVLVRFWDQRQQLELRDLRSYLFTAVRNEALNRLRNALVERRWRDRILAERRVEPAGGGANEAETRVEHTELAAALNRELAALPERCRLALTLRWQQQMSYAEIAEAMGISVKSVEVYLRRAMIALRAAHTTLEPHR